MPFDGIDEPWESSSYLLNPLKLVSFEVKDVNSVPKSKNAVSLSGILSIGVSRNITILYDFSLKFPKRPGISAPKIVFEGVYIETEEKGGERLFALLEMQVCHGGI